MSVCFANSGHLAPLSRVFTDSQCVYRRCNECRFRKRAVNVSEGVCGLWSMLRTLNSPGWHLIILEFIVFSKYNTMCDALLVKKRQSSKASIVCEWQTTWYFVRCLVLILWHCGCVWLDFHIQYEQINFLLLENCHIVSGKDVVRFFL